jgi:hypothetical protein
LLDDLESGEISASQLGIDKIAELLAAAKMELLKKFAAAEDQAAARVEPTNIVSFRGAVARLRPPKEGEPDGSRRGRPVP